MPGKVAVAVHVVDVEVQHVERNLARPKLTRQLAHLRLAAVAPARLVIAERPQRRHRRASGKASHRPHHVRRGRAAKNVVAHLAAVSRHAQGVRVGIAHVELAVVAHVQKHAPRQPGSHRYERRVRLIEVALVPPVTPVGIESPVGKQASAPLEHPRPLPEPVVRLALT